MKLLSKAALAATFSLAVSTTYANENKQPGQLLDYPYTQENPFHKPHELRFETPKDGIARAEFRSESFYAIILKSGQRCSFKEAERQQIQKLFPKNKVFMDRFGCDYDVEENISYTNVNPDYSFIAVYGGLGKSQAQQLLKTHNWKKSSLAQTFAKCRWS